MKKKLTCIECPKGCILTVEVEGERTVITVTGHECPKGEQYAKNEIENPVRILTSTVLAEGLSVKMVPVRTDKPVPKECISDIIKEIKKIKIKKPVKTGDIIKKNVLNLPAHLIATRTLR